VGFARFADREVDQVRGGARHPQLGRPEEPAGQRPALLRLLPSAAGGRAADLRRSGADGCDVRLHHAAAGRDRRRGGPVQGDHRDLLLDQQHADGPARRELRRLADQARGGDAEGGIPAPQDLRDALADPRVSRLAGEAGAGREAGVLGPAAGAGPQGAAAAGTAVACRPLPGPGTAGRQAAGPGGPLPPGQRRPHRAPELGRRSFRQGPEAVFRPHGQLSVRSQAARPAPRAALAGRNPHGSGRRGSVPSKTPRRGPKASKETRTWHPPA